MYKHLNCIIFIVLFSYPLIGQIDMANFEQEVTTFQTNLNNQYSDSAASPLLKKDLIIFNGHKFFEPNQDFYVEAKFKKAKNQKVFEMKTTTSRRPTYKKYGKVTFKIRGEKFKLNIYQNQRLMNSKLHADHLFLPFTDLTNGEESYGGGRYIDLTIPKSNKMIINFNNAYNPYCCYNHKYSCPIPPKENHLNIKVTAGVMAFEDNDH